MNWNWKASWWCVRKNNSFLVKFAVSILLVGLSFRLLFSQSTTGFSNVEQTPFIDETMRPESRNSKDFEGLYKRPPKFEDIDQMPTDLVNSSEDRDQIHQTEKCDLFTGDWIPNPAGPVYTNESCHLIENHQNCMMNGRPDTGYLYWRWNPRDCELPQFDSEIFLEMMRNKAWALIGDSIARNHIQSLLCMLSKNTNPGDGTSPFTTSPYQSFGPHSLQKQTFSKITTVFQPPNLSYILTNSTRRGPTCIAAWIT